MMAAISLDKPTHGAGRRAPSQEGFQWTSAALLVPGTTLIIFLFLGPLVFAFYLGFTNMELIGPRSHSYAFTGAANISRMVHDAVLHRSILLTITFLLGSAIIGQSLFGMVLALLMRPAVRVIRIFVGAVIGTGMGDS